jgi:carbonic anhydrase/acetyltransferase-like protein (isoleucine patch superfamily)
MNALYRLFMGLCPGRPEGPSRRRVYGYSVAVPAYPYGDRVPRIDATAFVAPGARVVGDVELAARSSVWFNAVLRGDSDRVRVGEGSNVQDGAVLDTDTGSPCLVGDACTIGHRAVVHGCRIGDGCLIGMGAVILSNAVIGPHSLVAAGALVPQGKRFPDRSLIVGSPAKSIRALTDEDIANLITPGVNHYQAYAIAYKGLNLND